MWIAAQWLYLDGRRESTSWECDHAISYTVLLDSEHSLRIG